MFTAAALALLATMVLTITRALLGPTLRYRVGLLAHQFYRHSGRVEIL